MLILGKVNMLLCPRHHNAYSPLCTNSSILTCTCHAKQWPTPPSIIIWLGFTSTYTVKLNFLNEMCVPDVGAFLLQGENETRIYNRNLQKLHVELWAKKNWLILLQLVSTELQYCLKLWSCWLKIMWIGCWERKFTKRKKDKMYPAFIYVLKSMLDDGRLWGNAAFDTWKECATYFTCLPRTR